LPEIPNKITPIIYDTRFYNRADDEPPDPTEGVGERVGTAFPCRVTTHHQNNNSNVPQQLNQYAIFLRGI